jgi:ASC-1-like (ASCH) protein
MSVRAAPAEVDVYGPAEPAEEDVYGEGDAQDDSVMHSIKRKFAALAMGPIIDYGSRYDVLHFVYDLVLWTTIGAKKNVGGAYAIPLRLMMQGSPMFPEYWKHALCGLHDLVRQCGYPRIFHTKSVYEKHMTYHRFLEDQLQKMHHERTQCAVPETLHVAHTLVESFRGAILGCNISQRGRKERNWQRNLLREPENITNPGRTNYLLRLEFQDGTRKQPTQDYHGSGRVHEHALGFAEKPEMFRLDKVASATLEHEDPLCSYVHDSQKDRNGKTPWEVHTDDSVWDDNQQRTYLYHTQTDHNNGVRAFFPDEMEVIPTHSDVQETNDDGALQAYLVKYPVKTSGSSSEEWLAGEGTGDALAQSVLFRYKPFEPEMVLQMFGARFRQWRIGSRDGGVVTFHVPVPDVSEDKMPEVVKLYEQCAWRHQGDKPLSLLDFLRRSNKEAAIIDWLQKKWKAECVDGQPTLEEYACKYKMFGERVVAAQMLSWRNDRRAGQHLLLHVPFTEVKELFHRSVEKVPSDYRYLAMAMLSDNDAARNLWTNEEALKAAMQREGYKQKFRESAVRQIMANVDLVQEYLDGRLNRDLERENMEKLNSRPVPFAIKWRWEEAIQQGLKTVEGRIHTGTAAAVQEGQRIKLGGTSVLVTAVTRHDSFRDMLQHHSLQACLPGVSSERAGVKIYHSFHNYARDAEQHGVVAWTIQQQENRGQLKYEDLNRQQKDFYDEAMRSLEYTFAVRDAEDDFARQRIIDDTPPKAIVCFGPPGTGKTTAVFLIIDYVLENDGYVLFAVYTAQLASRMREKYAKHPRKHQIRIDTCHGV